MKSELAVCLCRKKETPAILTLMTSVLALVKSDSQNTSSSIWHSGKLVQILDKCATCSTYAVITTTLLNH